MRSLSFAPDVRRVGVATVLALCLAPVVVLAGASPAAAASLAFTDAPSDGSDGLPGAGDISAVRVDHGLSLLAVTTTMTSDQISLLQVGLDTSEQPDGMPDYGVIFDAPVSKTFLLDGDSNLVPCEGLSTTASASADGLTLRMEVPRTCLAEPPRVAVRVVTSYFNPNLAIDYAPDSGYSDSVTSDATGTIRPRVSGTPRVGTALTAVPGSWESAEAAVTGQQWLVGGLPVHGATAPTFTPRPSDLGQPIQVRYTASTPAGTMTATSDPTAPVARGALTRKTRSKIAGTLRVGRVLTAKPGRWAPSDVTVTYRWFARKRGADRFVKIARARKAKLRLSPQLAGAQVRARVLVRHPGYEPRRFMAKRAGRVDR